jgi:hypothetical protein
MLRKAPKGKRFPDCLRLPPRSLFRSGLDETAARADQAGPPYTGIAISQTSPSVRQLKLISPLSWPLTMVSMMRDPKPE